MDFDLFFYEAVHAVYALLCAIFLLVVGSFVLAIFIAVTLLTFPVVPLGIVFGIICFIFDELRDRRAKKDVPLLPAPKGYVNGGSENDRS